MKDPKSIPDALIEKMMQAAYQADPQQFPAPSNLDAQDGMRAAMAAVWEEVWGEGFTFGFEDKEISETMAELLEEHGWAPHMTIWADGASPDEAEALFDSVLDAADELAPGTVTLGALGTMNPGKRWKPEEEPDGAV